jgi:hypothetical protein
MSDSTLLASLMATTQVPTPAAPAAPTAPVVPPAPAAPVVQYYVVDNGVTKQVPAAALTAAIAAGYTGPVMRVGDSE